MDGHNTQILQEANSYPEVKLDPQTEAACNCMSLVSSAILEYTATTRVDSDIAKATGIPYSRLSDALASIPETEISTIQTALKSGNELQVQSALSRVASTSRSLCEEQNKPGGNDG